MSIAGRAASANALQRAGSLLNVRFGLERELSPICNAIQLEGPNSADAYLATL